MYYKVMVIFFILCAFHLKSAAQDKEEPQPFETHASGIGTSAAAFLEIGIGARAMAMGGAYVSITNDATALFWNPAGIVQIAAFDLELMHSNWLASTNFDYVGLVASVESINSAVGVSITSLDYGEQPVRTVERPEGTGEIYAARDVCLSLSLATMLTQNFSVGLSLKYVSQKIWEEYGSAMAADIGILYQTPVDGLRFGASISNFGTELQFNGRQMVTIVDPDPTVENFDRVPVEYKTSAYPLPLMLRVGFSYTKPLGKFGQIIIAADMNHPSNSTENINLGFEYLFADMFYLRVGYANLFEKNSVNGLTAGAGLDYRFSGKFGFRIDYAWSDWGMLNSADRFSVGFSF